MDRRAGLGNSGQQGVGTCILGIGPSRLCGGLSTHSIASAVALEAIVLEFAWRRSSGDDGIYVAPAAGGLPI